MGRDGLLASNMSDPFACLRFHPNLVRMNFRQSMGESGGDFLSNRRPVRQQLWSLGKDDTIQLLQSPTLFNQGVPRQPQHFA